MEFLSLVDPALIPLHLIQGPPLHVNAGSDSSQQQWLEDVLFERPLDRGHLRVHENDDASFSPQHSEGLEQSQIALLCRPSNLPALEDAFPRMTEILIYAERTSPTSHRLPTPPLSSDVDRSLYDQNAPAPARFNNIEYRALFLSSDVLYPSLPVPKLEPRPNEARFVDIQPPSKKRLSDLFDDASDRRQKARHHGAHNISIAASRASDTPKTPQTPEFGATIKQEPSETSLSDADITRTAGANVLQPRRRTPLPSPMTPSAASSRPISRRATLERSRSSLSQVVTSDELIDSSVQAKNKQAVSRIVMAGMRLYGLQQHKSKSEPQKQGSESPITPAVDTFRQDADAEQDVEYKGIYHQTYKGTLFALVSEPVYFV